MLTNSVNLKHPDEEKEEQQKEGKTEKYFSLCRIFPVPVVTHKLYEVSVQTPKIDHTYPKDSEKWIIKGHMAFKSEFPGLWFTYMPRNESHIDIHF